jgi:hypothetical protein
MGVLMDLPGLRRQLGFAVNLLRRRPFQCLLQVTNRCNMKCSFCDFWPNGALPHEELTIDEFRQLAGQLSGLGRFLVSIEGGEPFVRADLSQPRECRGSGSAAKSWGAWQESNLRPSDWKFSRRSR